MQRDVWWSSWSPSLPYLFTKSCQADLQIAFKPVLTTLPVHLSLQSHHLSPGCFYTLLPGLPAFRLFFYRPGFIMCPKLFLNSIFILMPPYLQTSLALQEILNKVQTHSLPLKAFTLPDSQPRSTLAVHLSGTHGPYLTQMDFFCSRDMPSTRRCLHSFAPAIPSAFSSLSQSSPPGNLSWLTTTTELVASSSRFLPPCTATPCSPRLVGNKMDLRSQMIR